MAALEKIIIHLVHGTWPYGPRTKARNRWKGLKERLDERRNDTLDDRFWDELQNEVAAPQPRCRRADDTLARDRFWFLEGSIFCEKIVSFYREIKGSASLPIEFVTFTWSSENSFTERNKAATGLRTHLEDSLRDNRDAYHVVVAHSHGGTVAIEAITNLPQERQQSLAGVLTMETPFVALRKSSSDKAEQYARALVLGWGRPLVVCLGLASVGGLVLGPGWFVNTFALLIALVCIFILARVATGVDWLKPRNPECFNALLALSDDPKLECPLIAYRAPGDEASYVISAAQITDWFFGQIVYGRLIVGPIDCLKRLIARFRALPSVITTWTMTSLAFFICDWLFTKELQPLWIYLIGGPGYLMLFSLVLLGAVPLILLPGAVALGKATGREAFQCVGYSTVDAESLPVGIPASMEVLTLSGEERRTMFRHSLHKLDVMRKRIGEWLGQHCSDVP